MDRWFGPDHDGQVMTDAELALAIECDDLGADFVEDARQWWNELTHLRAENERLRAMTSAGDAAAFEEYVASQVEAERARADRAEAECARLQSFHDDAVKWVALASCSSVEELHSELGNQIERLADREAEVLRLETEIGKREQDRNHLWGRLTKAEAELDRLKCARDD